jgi:ATP-dependent DNA helicase DinG
MLANLPESSEESAGLADRATAASRDLLTILDDDQRGEFAPWVERREGGIILHASPTHVGGLIREKLYEKIQSVVFTSATLSSGGTLTYFKSRLGLDDEPAPTEAILDSPFDHANNTMLYIPRSIPEPTSPSFVRSLGPVLADILERTQGRAFVLFTSYRNMEAAYRQIDGSAPFPLLLQGTRPKRRLLEEFRERMGSVLFATSSFWEGVDVQGEALSCVVVDRLPFAPPDDPIVAARIERIRTEGGDAFFSFQVPMAVLALKQGLGRLIRTQTDRGVLAILDTRILTRGYGRIFRDSLYECPIHRDPEAIDQFFADEPRQ